MCRIRLQLYALLAGLVASDDVLWKSDIFYRLPNLQPCSSLENSFTSHTDYENGRAFKLDIEINFAGALQVGGIKIYTSDEVEAVNGTDIRLKCTFSSSSPLRASSVSVSWNFRPMGPGREESVFFFQDKPYPPTDGRFRKKVTWAGDIMGGDASIMLRQVKFTYNGTYSCQVKNPPDVHGIAGEIELRVVATASYSEIAILAGAVAGTIGLMMLIAGFIMCIRRCRKPRPDGEASQPPRERKDPTLCHPAEAVHLYLENEVEMEVDSSDGEPSEESSGDEEEESEEEDDDSSDGEEDDDDDD